jgi:uncharacterized protein (DUF849 family)
VRGTGQACLHNGRGSQIRHVEDGACPVVLCHGLAQHIVGKPSDDSNMRIGLSCQQGDFEVQRVIIVGTDDRLRVGNSGCTQTLWRLQCHDAGAGVMQFLDDPHPERIVSTHDDVPTHPQNATAEKPLARGENGQMPTSTKTYVKACINGARTPDQHPNLPVSPEQLAVAAVAAHGAGAKAVHMHPKTAEGIDSLLPEDVDAAVSAVRHAAPGLPLGVTTGFWALPDQDARLLAVDGWTVLPDFASVNWHEPGADELARLLLSKGLGVEVGIFHAEAAESWAASEMAEHCMRVMIELPSDADIAAADDLLSQVLAVGSPAPTLLHGFDESCWPLLEHAGKRGVQTRIGMEDTLRLPDGSVAPDNAALVFAAVQLLTR